MDSPAEKELSSGTHKNILARLRLAHVSARASCLVASPDQEEGASVVSVMEKLA